MPVKLPLTHLAPIPPYAITVEVSIDRPSRQLVCMFAQTGSLLTALLRTLIRMLMVTYF